MPTAVSCSLALCAAQTDSVISDLRGIANIIFCPIAFTLQARQINTSMQKWQRTAALSRQGGTGARSAQLLDLGEAFGVRLSFLALWGSAIPGCLINSKMN